MKDDDYSPEQISAVMELLGWTWFNKKHAPSAEEIRQKLTCYKQEVTKRDNCSGYGSGGLFAQDEGGGYIALYLQIPIKL